MFQILQCCLILVFQKIKFATIGNKFECLIWPHNYKISGNSRKKSENTAVNHHKSTGRVSTIFVYNGTIYG